MTTVLLIIHLFVTLALIGVVLIQRSEGGGLGVGSSQGMGAFMSGRGTANLLTRTTAILAALFFALSLGLALLNQGTTVGNTRSILDTPPGQPAVPTTPALTPRAPPPPPAPATPASPAPAASAPAAPAAPAPAPAAPGTGTGTGDAAIPALPEAPPPPPNTAQPAH